MEKYVRITGKRQVTIPKDFFDQLRMGSVLRAYVEDGRLVMEPVRVEDPMDFTQEIINDLADEGLTGEELKKEFARRREGMLAAMKKLVEESRKEALESSEPDGDAFMEELINGDA
ncbi:AbrB/MazE/SpoVT family DNA-binding domain-containing protein [Alicyclobacillus macrosporangiidus]|uniref:AbrB/MazE/SpoVT family DNA-binding domain-containing protein n=1 Tax=Alicyclobacillus macrosporangiidus TaxID=392015 RepID=UPI000943F3A8|nr:AbrB/MazE/SpoVT family DNA-binding domain-containing protein [Alicyclobacillus macrosporangiidus]